MVPFICSLPGSCSCALTACWNWYRGGEPRTYGEYTLEKRALCAIRVQRLHRLVLSCRLASMTYITLHSTIIININSTTTQGTTR